MIYYVDREIIDQNQGSCLSLGCAGKFIAFIELTFYSFIFFSVKGYLSGEWNLIKTASDVWMTLLLLSCRRGWWIVHFGDGSGTAVDILRVPLHRCHQSESSFYLAMAVDEIRSDKLASDSLRLCHHWARYEWQKPGWSIAHIRAAAVRWKFPFD